MCLRIAQTLNRCPVSFSPTLSLATNLVFCRFVGAAFVLAERTEGVRQELRS